MPTWDGRGIKSKEKPFRYKIFVDPSWLEESLGEQSPTTEKHASHKQNVEGTRKRKADEITPRPNWRDLPGERKKNYHRVMVQLWFQAYKARKRAKAPDFAIYQIDRVGVPGPKEWICDRTHYIARAVDPESGLIEKNRIYYDRVEKFSIMAYNFLSDLGHEQFSALLDAYIRRLIIFPLPFSYESERLEKIFEQRLAKTGEYYGKVQCLNGTTKERALFGQSAQVKMQAVFLNSTSSKPICDGGSASRPLTQKDSPSS